MKVRVSVPATIANLGPGFDVVGMAVGVHCLFEAETSQGSGDGESRISIRVSGEGASDIPVEPGSNLVVRAMEALASKAGLSLPPMSVAIHNSIPLARGMGSSAAAIMGGLVVANEVLGRPLATEALLELACQIEGHPDNVVPALVGGFAVSAMAGDKVIFCRLPAGQGLKVVVAVPDFEVRTEDARRVLPRQVALKDAVFNLSRLALLISSLVENRLDRLGLAMEDRLHQPYRQGLVPGLADVFARARSAGALGAALAGSGPSVVALALDRADQVAASMVEAFSQNGIPAEVKITCISARGARVVSCDDLEAAKALLESHGSGLVLVKGGKLLFEAYGGGVKPLLEAVLRLGDELSGAACADKIVGRASGLLLRYAGVDSVYAGVVGCRAQRELLSSGVFVESGKSVEGILNRDRTGPCPFEELMRPVDDPEAAVRILRERFSI